jgi:hypothetical protein
MYNGHFTCEYTRSRVTRSNSDLVDAQHIYQRGVSLHLPVSSDSEHRLCAITAKLNEYRNRQTNQEGKKTTEFTVRPS